MRVPLATAVAASGNNLNANPHAEELIQPDTAPNGRSPIKRSELPKLASADVPSSSEPAALVPAIEPNGSLPEASSARVHTAPTAVTIFSNVAHHMLGNVLFACGQFDAAAKNYNEAALADQNDHFAYYRQANALAAGGHWKEAYAEYEQAIRLKPDFKQAILKRDRLNKYVGGK
jgi:tetratricopeptide (TPR) repeat protein